jgi:hypothetical protein
MLGKNACFWACFLGIFFIAAPAFAQKNPHPARPDDENKTDDDSEMQVLIENLLQDTDEEDFSFDTQFEYLEEYAKNPLDLNNSSKEDFEALGLLSEIQVQGLLNYRKEVGQIYSVYELLNIPAWDRLAIIKTIPYISLQATQAREKLNLVKAFKYGKNVIFSRYQRIFETQEGFVPAPEGSTSQRYMGSADRIYARYRMTYKDRMSLGLTAEKDAGEEFFKGSNKKGFDFYSYHFYLKDINKHISAAVLGDYQMYMGQGLIMWAGFGIRKSPAVLNVKRIANPIKAYTSANEALFLRGAATTLQFGKRNQLEVTPFVSYRNRDANIAQVDTSDNGDNEEGANDGDNVEASSFQNFGFHRTPNEIADRNALKLFTTGITLKYKGNNWHIASNTVYDRLDKPLNRGDDLYQIFLFKGKSLVNTSLDYSYSYKSFQFFGESALSQNGGLATINGVLANLDPKVNLSMVYRNYARNYQNLHANAFGERTGVNNESGLYIGLEMFPMSGLRLSGYVDFYKMPWATFTTTFPTQGLETFVKAEYNITRRWNVYSQLKVETKGRNRSPSEGFYNVVVPNTRVSWRAHANFAISDQLDLRTRVELSRYTNPVVAKGVVIYQDINYHPTFAPLTAQFRLALFDTDDYNSRIYAYENDVLYSFSVPAYYGKGMRWYLNLSYDVGRNLSLWLRFAQTYYADREVISSGLGEINGRTRTDMRFQIRYQF